MLHFVPRFPRSLSCLQADILDGGVESTSLAGLCCCLLDRDTEIFSSHSLPGRGGLNSIAVRVYGGDNLQLHKAEGGAVGPF